MLTLMADWGRASLERAVFFVVTAGVPCRIRRPKSSAPHVRVRRKVLVGIEVGGEYRSPEREANGRPNQLPRKGPLEDAHFWPHERHRSLAAVEISHQRLVLRVGSAELIAEAFDGAWPGSNAVGPKKLWLNSERRLTQLCCLVRLEAEIVYRG
ncbi:MAG: hypothetical protein WCH93_08745 [Actinomycetota bacterium]